MADNIEKREGIYQADVCSQGSQGFLQKCHMVSTGDDKKNKARGNLA